MATPEPTVKCPFCAVDVTTRGDWPFVSSMLLIHFEKCAPTMRDFERRDASDRLASAHAE